MNRFSHFNLMSLGLIIFISVFAGIRFAYLPQFIDAYYHLSVSNAFIESGGWVGWDWWCFAPFGRPHVYPPLYHFILVFLQKIGMSRLNSARITEVLIVPGFFFSTWYIFKKLVSERFSFFIILILSSFFAFYSSVSANIPASLAIIFGFLGWFFAKNKKLISAVSFLVFCFYTHVGIAWIFLLSFLMLAFLNLNYRKLSFKIILVTLPLIAPLLYHQIKYIDYFTSNAWCELNAIRISFFIMLLGGVSLFLQRDKREFHLALFWGYLLGSLLVFVFYPYRLFSGQGIIGLAFFSALILEKIKFAPNAKKATLLFAGVIAYLFFFHSTIDFNESKPRFNLLDSTYYNFFTGNSSNFLRFQSILSPQHFSPVMDVIEENSSSNDIITSNSPVVSQMVTAITARPSARSVFKEICPKNKFNHYRYAKMIIWLKFDQDKSMDISQRGFKKLYENDIAYVFLNLNYPSSVKTVKSKINFKIISIIIVLMSGLILSDNIRVQKALKKDSVKTG